MTANTAQSSFTFFEMYLGYSQSTPGKGLLLTKKKKKLFLK